MKYIVLATKQLEVEDGFAYAVKKAEEIKTKKQEITPAAAVKSALKLTTTERVAEAKGVEEQQLNPEKINEGEKIDD